MAPRKLLPVLSIGLGLVGLLLLAWLVQQIWLWLLVVVVVGGTLGWSLHNLSRSIWDEGGTGRGRMWFLQRPAGMGGQPGAILLTQEPPQSGEPGHLTASISETAWMQSGQHSAGSLTSDDPAQAIGPGE